MIWNFDAVRIIFFYTIILINFYSYILIFLAEKKNDTTILLQRWHKDKQTKIIKSRKQKWKNKNNYRDTSKAKQRKLPVKWYGNGYADET